MSSTGKGIYHGALSDIIEKTTQSTFTRTILKDLRTKGQTKIKPPGKLFLEILFLVLNRKGYSPIIYISQDEDEIFFMGEELKTVFDKKTGLFSATPEEVSLNLDETEARLLTLEGIISGTTEIMITDINALIQNIPSKDALEKSKIRFRINQSYDFSALAAKLDNNGFSRVSTVSEVGEFSIRGNIVDIYGFNMDLPRRIEFVGDKIVSVRSFDPFTQRTETIDTEFVLLPILEACNGKEIHSIMDYISGQALFIFPEFLFLDEVYENLPDIRHRNQIIISNDGVDAGIQKPMDFHGNLQLFREHLTKIQEHRVYICCESDEERKRCEYLLEDEFPSLRFETLNIGEGLVAQEWNLFVFTDKEIFGKGFHPKRIEKSEITFKPENLSELKPGDFVVHEDYGIGIFQKIGKIEHKGQPTECLMIEFEGGDVLYVPIGAMARVSKYRGLIKGAPKLSNLSSMRWEKRKRGAKKAIEDMTKDLLKLYAERKLLKGFRFSQDTVWQKELEARFQYEETEDQLRAIQDIKNDMESDRPMDRLVCGEVGYGKTEVAIRASFKAAMDSKQVLFLAPTTVLCEQHYQTFTERLHHFPVKISMLSRFVSKSEQKQIIDDTKTGKVDIVIGTHALLGDKISFHDPGLLIIDEEHRFGVAQKEKLKNTRKKMDVLSMSATPIPRTLQFSLLNIRDFSIIQTPPKGRLSVITRIIRYNSGFIREIILAEIRRGGQVFFVHNRIEELNSVAARVERIVPEANITVTHGRMKSILIEKRMLDFLSGKKNVLVTTSIIESGIDIPNANTIIIDRADLFGLAQLHQLRGRVGRSNRRAYCYLIVPVRISREARKRLSTIYTHSHLGSGFALALKDLEIRGAGNLLGHKQHGHIASIGYDLYMKFLQETIRGLKGETRKEKEIPEVYSDLAAFLPAPYVEDEISRINIYRRLSAACNSQTVHTIEEDLNDRFGTPPQEAKTLLLLSLTKIICSGKGIEKVSLHKDYVELSFSKDRFPKKKNIENLLKNVHKKYFIDYSEGYFRIGFNVQLKKIIADLKKVLQFFP